MTGAQSQRCHKSQYPAPELTSSHVTSVVTNSGRGNDELTRDIRCRLMLCLLQTLSQQL